MNASNHRNTGDWGPARGIRVMCVDDNELLASAMERQIGVDPRFVWAGWVNDTREVCARVREAHPDVLLLDIDMPGEVFALIEAVAAVSPTTRVLMFSAYVRQDYIDRAVEMGAWGYISKNESMPDVFDAIERAAGGQFVLSGDALGEQRVRPPAPERRRGVTGDPSQPSAEK